MLRSNELSSWHNKYGFHAGKLYTEHNLYVILRELQRGDTYCLY